MSYYPAISGRPENAEIVKKLYSKEIEYCKANKKLTDMYNTLVDAMVMQDFIAEKGKEAYLNLHRSKAIDTLSLYFDKYQLRF